MQSEHIPAKPFLKWAGGKNQIVNSIEEYLPPKIKHNKKIDKYFELFLGGGAVFFHLIKEGYTIDEVYLNDLNKELILTYKTIRDKPKKVISKLESCANAYSIMNQEERRIYFNDIRRDFNDNLDDFDYLNYSYDHIIRAAQMIFLNRTCFNGLYRVNKNGKFNVPVGSYKNPLICDKENILNVSEVLRKVNIYCDDYSKFKEKIDENSFIYLDPPYLPIKENSFTSYNSEGFGLREQEELSRFCKKIDEKNAYFLLSNSCPKNGDSSTINFFANTYGSLNLKKCNHKKIDARRSINSKGNKRGAIKELLIFNY